ncbi:MAG: tetratricopeptide repeat protein, partial [Planctomycetes bacterium]|nr:tetratricopeptide repeat protein [Planctomycetota bacterium]
MAQGRWSEAAAAYAKLIRLEETGRQPYLGSLVEALVGRGVACLEEGDLQDAILYLAKAQAVMPDSPQPALLLGKAYYLMAQREKAERVFEDFFLRTGLKDDFALEVAGLYYAFWELGKTLPWA